MLLKFIKWIFNDSSHKVCYSTIDEMQRTIDYERKMRNDAEIERDHLECINNQLASELRMLKERIKGDY